MSFWRQVLRRALRECFVFAGWDSAGKALFKLGPPVVLVLIIWWTGNLDALAKHLGEVLGAVVATVTVLILIYAFAILTALPKMFDEAQTSSEREIAGARAQIVALQARLKPQIRLFVNPVNNGVLQIPTELTAPGQPPGPSSKWVQVCVACASEVELEDCEALITSFRRLNNDGSETELEPEPVHCSWSMRDGPRTTIRPMVELPANILTVYESAHPVMLQLVPPHITIFNAVQVPGRFRFRIVVTAKGTPSVEKSFVLEHLDYARVSITPSDPS